jgi:hypothetical protein
MATNAQDEVLYKVSIHERALDTIKRSLYNQIANGMNVGRTLSAISATLPDGNYLVSPHTGEPIRGYTDTKQGKITEKNLLSVGWYKLIVKN